MVAGMWAVSQMRDILNDAWRNLSPDETRQRGERGN